MAKKGRAGNWVGGWVGNWVGGFRQEGSIARSGRAATA